MKKSLLSKVDSLLEGMIGRLENLEKVAVDQFPAICQEIIAERKIEIENDMILSAAGLIISLVVLIPTSIYFFNHVSDEHSTGLQFISGIGALISSIVLFFTGGGVLMGFLSLRELKATPKLYVLRQLRRMISK